VAEQCCGLRCGEQNAGGVSRCGIPDSRHPIRHAPTALRGAVPQKPPRCGQRMGYRRFAPQMERIPGQWEKEMSG